MNWVWGAVLLEFLILALLVSALFKLIAWETGFRTNRGKWLADLRDLRRQVRQTKRQSARLGDTVPTNLMLLLPPKLRKAFAAFRIMQKVSARRENTALH